MYSNDGDKNMSAIKTLVIVSTFLVSGASAQAGDKIVCKKRTPQVYTAFYRVEIEQMTSEYTRFEYGIGDSNQTFEIYFRAPVQKISETHYDSVKGTDSADLTVDLVKKRGKTQLQFTIVDADGKAYTRKGYVCE